MKNIIGVIVLLYIFVCFFLGFLLTLGCLNDQMARLNKAVDIYIAEHEEK